jgi:PAS domain S-box-containing protein
MNSLPADNASDGRNVVAAVRLARRAAAIAVMVIVVVVGGLDIIHARTRLLVAQSLTMTRLAHEVLARVKDEQIGLGGYVMAGDSLVLGHGAAPRAALAAKVDSLVLLSNDNPTQHTRARAIQVVIASWTSQRVIPADNRRQFGPMDGAAGAAHGPVLGDIQYAAIRSALQQLLSAQERLYDERAAYQVRTDRSAMAALAIGLLVLTAILWLFGRRILEQTTNLVRQQEHLEQQAMELEEQTTALERQAHDAHALAAQVAAANEQLGAMVQRAAEVRGELSGERRFLRQVIDVNPHLIYAKDRSGRFTLVNQAVADLYGGSIDDLIGHTDADFNSNAAEVEAFRRADLEVMDSMEPRFIAEESITDARGVVHFVQTVKCPIVGANGRADQVLGVTTDITERKRLETELVHSHKLEAVGRLAGGVAHDFNNMLTAIKSYSELLREALDPGDERRADAEEITKAADRAAVLTRQLLAFGRRQLLEPRLLDMNHTVTEVEQMLRRLLVGDAVFVTQLGAGVWPVLADAGQLEQVLINLVVNARDAMPDGGTVTIRTENIDIHSTHQRGSGPDTMPPGSYVRLAVSDTGVGIDAETRGRIFEPFFTTKERGKGTGLGLATVYGIVRQSAGYVEVDSTPGAGTTFSIYLPKTAVAADARAVPAPAGVRRSRLETILVVDDDTAVRGVVRRILEGGGYRVIEAENGHAAIDAADSDTGIGILVTDMVMPEIGGRELALAIRGLHPDIAVLLMSGYTNAPTLRTEIDDTGFAFIEKPFTAAALLQAVADLLLDAPVPV